MGSERARAMPVTDTKTYQNNSSRFAAENENLNPEGGEQRPEATGLQPVSQRVDKSDKPIPSVVGRAFSGWSI